MTSDPSKSLIINPKLILGKKGKIEFFIKFLPFLTQYENIGYNCLSVTIDRKECILLTEKLLVSVSSPYDGSLMRSSHKYSDHKAISEGMFLPARVRPRMAQVGEIFHNPGFSINFGKDTHIFHLLTSLHIISHSSNSLIIIHLLILGKKGKTSFFIMFSPWLTQDKKL